MEWNGQPAAAAGDVRLFVVARGRCTSRGHGDAFVIECDARRPSSRHPARTRAATRAPFSCLSCRLGHVDHTHPRSLARRSQLVQHACSRWLDDGLRAALEPPARGAARDALVAHADEHVRHLQDEQGRLQGRAVHGHSAHHLVEFRGPQQDRLLRWPDLPPRDQRIHVPIRLPAQQGPALASRRHRRPAGWLHLHHARRQDDHARRRQHPRRGKPSGIESLPRILTCATSDSQWFDPVTPRTWASFPTSR